MPPVTVNQQDVTLKSGHRGFAVSGFPDVCHTPSPAGPVPIPYPIAAGYAQQNAAAAKKTTVSGASATTTGAILSSSKGNEPAVKVTTPSRVMLSQQILVRMESLGMQIRALPAGDPSRWHRAVDEYVVLAAELYKARSG